MLHNLFVYQRSLMDKLAPVERALGYTPPPVPLDFNLRAHQDWFRLMSWYLVEEIVETQIAPKEMHSEELADCLHFAIELCILAGVSPEQVEAKAQLDMFEDAPRSYTLFDVTTALGAAVNLLKAKHLKRNPQSTNLELFRSRLAYTLYVLLRHILSHGYKADEIYMAKHKENENRIQTHY